MHSVLIIYHSQGGHTEQLARAVAEGAQLEPVHVVMRRALEASLADLLACDALIVGTPEYNGYMAGAVKDFLDRTYEPAQAQLKDGLPYAIFVSAGNDGTNAVRFIQRIARGYPLREVAAPVICRGQVTEDALAQCQQLGQTIAAGLDFGLF